MIKCKDCAFFKEGTCEKLKTEKDHAKLYAVILNSQVQDSKNELLNQTLRQVTKSLLEFEKTLHHNYEKEPRENFLAKEIEPLPIDTYVKKALIKCTEQLNLNARPEKVYSANIEYLSKFLLTKEGELIYHLGNKESRTLGASLNNLYAKATRSINSHRLVERLTDKYNQLGLYGKLEMNAYKSSVIGLTSKKAKTLNKILRDNHDKIYFTLQKFLDNSLDPLVVRNYCESAIRDIQRENINIYENIEEYEESSYGEAHIIDNVVIEIHEGFLTEVDAALISLIDIITFFSYFSLINLSNSLQNHAEAEYLFRQNVFEHSKTEKVIREELIDKDFTGRVVSYAQTDAKLLIARTQNSLMILHNHQKKLLNILNKSEGIKKLAKQELTCLKAAPRFDIATANLLRKKTRNISV